MCSTKLCFQTSAAILKNPGVRQQTILETMLFPNHVCAFVLAALGIDENPSHPSDRSLNLINVYFLPDLTIPTT